MNRKIEIQKALSELNIDIDTDLICSLDNECNCWGLTSKLFKWIPRFVWIDPKTMIDNLKKNCERVAKNKIQRGDIVSYWDTGSLFHTGIILNKTGLILHKIGGDRVEVENMNTLPEYITCEKKFYRPTIFPKLALAYNKDVI